MLIHEIYPDSPAAKSKVLKAGDKLLKINDVDLKGLNHDVALESLRSAQDKVGIRFTSRAGIAYF